MFWCLVLLIALPVLAEDAERGQIIQTVREFARRNRVPLDPNFSPNEINSFRINYITNNPEFSATGRIMVSNRFAFFFAVHDTNVEVSYFKLVNPSMSALIENRPLSELASVAAKTNLLTEETAFRLAKEYFKLQGHKDENFHAPFFKQITFGNKEHDPKHYFAFPFYEAEWVRKDAKNVPSDLQQVMLPNVVIRVSGITSNLEYYSKVSLPVGKDFETSFKAPKKGVKPK